MSQYSFDPYAPVKETNGLGIAGFVCSLVGILTGGLLSPIGLILSLVALGRRPRGFAVAGVVIGAIGSCGAIIVVLLAGGAILAALGIAAVAIALSEPEKVELTSEMANIAVQVEKYKDENHYVPASLTLLHIKDTVLNDPWGTPYKYVVQQEGKSFDLVSAGQDKTFDTKDDLSLSHIDRVWAGVHNIHIGGNEHGGAVQIQLGDNKVDVNGGENGGTVTVEAGGRTLHIKGDAQGGTVDVGTQPATRPE